eukprot:358777-Chlamydomonas_euryale.AAC.1
MPWAATASYKALMWRRCRRADRGGRRLACGCRGACCELHPPPLQGLLRDRSRPQGAVAGASSRSIPRVLPRDHIACPRMRPAPPAACQTPPGTASLGFRF